MDQQLCTAQVVLNLTFTESDPKFKVKNITAKKKNVER